MVWVHHQAIDFELGQEFRIYPTADWQLEGKTADLEYIKSWVGKVSEDENGMAMFLGDIQDNDRPSTRSLKRKAFHERPEVLLDETRARLKELDSEIVPLLLPLAKMRLPMLGMLAGHHYADLYFEKDGQLVKQTSTNYICQQLTLLSGREVPYLGIMSAWVHLSFRKKGSTSTIKKLLHIQHGVGGGGTPEAAVRRLRKTSEGHYADAYVRAHDCQQVIVRMCVNEPLGHGENARIRQREILMMNIGSATAGPVITRGDPDYSEMEMMNPVPRGWGVISVNMRRASRHDDDSRNCFAELHGKL